MNICNICCQFCETSLTLPKPNNFFHYSLLFFSRACFSIHSLIIPTGRDPRRPSSRAGGAAGGAAACAAAQLPGADGSSLPAPKRQISGEKVVWGPNWKGPRLCFF